MKATVLALALLAAGAAFAGSPAPGNESREARHMDDLATLLDLTDPQRVQVQSILEAEHAKMKQSFEQAKAAGTKPDWQQMKALHQQLEQETLQKLAAPASSGGAQLSASQLKKFQILSQHKRPHFHHGPPSGTDAAEPATPQG